MPVTVAREQTHVAIAHACVRDSSQTKATGGRCVAGTKAMCGRHLDKKEVGSTHYSGDSLSHPHEHPHPHPHTR
jgi:hypothetical protein